MTDDSMNKKKKNSLQKKIIILSVSLVALAIISFSSITAIRLYNARDEIREQGQEAAKKVRAKSGFFSIVDDLKNLKTVAAVEAEDLDTMIYTGKPLLEAYAFQLQDIYDNLSYFKDVSVSPPMKALSGNPVPQFMTPESKSATGQNSKLLKKLNQITPNLCHIMETMPDKIDSITMALPDGQSVIIDSSPELKLDPSGKPLPYDAREEAWYQSSTKEQMTTVTYTDSTCFEDTPTVWLSQPVYDKDFSKLICVLCTAVKVERIASLMKEYSSIDSSFCILIDSEGKVICSQASSSSSSEKTPTYEAGHDLSTVNDDLKDICEDLKKGEVEAYETQISEKSYYIGAAPLTQTGWGILLFIDSSVFESKTDTLVKSLDQMTGRAIRLSDDNLFSILIRIIIISAILILLAFLLSIFFSKKVAKPYIDAIVAISAQKERMETELSIATRIQADVLPKPFPLFPEREDFDVYASMDPAREVGGDFYDIFLIDEDHLALVVGDVSDKGVPAALFMMISKTLIKTRSLAGGTPSEILADVNNQLEESHTNEMFVTVWLGILTLSTGVLLSANAGHENPLIRKPKDNYVLHKTPHGLVMGSMRNMKYKDEETVLTPGDILFMYTDGVPDATDADDNRWGLERMTEALNRHTDCDPATLLPAMKAEVDAYVGEASQFDDLTMLALEYKGSTD